MSIPEYFQAGGEVVVSCNKCGTQWAFAIDYPADRLVVNLGFALSRLEGHSCDSPPNLKLVEDKPNA